MDLNKVFLIGRVAATPELRRTPGGNSVTTFGMATNNVSKDKAGNRVERTEWHNVVLWGRQAEVASQFLTKGSQCLIEGRLQTREWQDKQGVKRRTTEVIGERMQLGAKPKGAGEDAAPSSRVVKPRYANEDQGMDLNQEPTQPHDLPIVQTGDEGPSEALPFPFGEEESAT